MRPLFNRFIRQNRIPLVLTLMVVSLGLWIVCAKLIVPPVIENAYRGESWSFLNRGIQGQATHPVSEYLQDWDVITAEVFLAGKPCSCCFYCTNSPCSKLCMAVSRGDQSRRSLLYEDRSILFERTDRFDGFGLLESAAELAHRPMALGVR